MTSQTTTVPTSTAAGSRPALPTPGLVTLLQSITSYPAVSLLMTTTPAPRMLPEDADQLLGMVRQAESRLAEEGLPGVQGTLLDLAAAAEDAVDGPTTEAIAVFVSSVTRAVVHLNLPVADRVVVDPTFATRDLVRALHRTPLHVVLALSRHEARLFTGMGDDLHPVPGRSFPRLAAAAESARRGGPGIRVEDRGTFYRDVDRALGAYLRVHPAPLVLVGAERELAEFRALSTNLGRLAGCVHGSLVTAPITDLVPRIRPVIESYLRSRQQEAVALLEARMGSRRVVSGIAATWLAAQAERPEMLAVEEGFFFPARVDTTGELLTAADDVEHPDVVDDAVDELIETVLHRGGWVAIVEDGMLADHDRVALTLRR
jgi:hypothetical protein